MADLTKSTNVGMDASTGMFAAQISGLLAGEVIATGDALYIKGSDGRLWKGVATAENEAARFAGLAPAPAAAGEACSCYSAGSIWEYTASGLTPGALIYLGGAAGKLADAAGTGHPAPVGRAISATRIQITSAI